MLNISVIQKVVVYALPLIFAITLHEAAHAYMAKKYGDDTAVFLGRLSLNPLRHIDPIGTILFPLIGIIFGGFIFGWAKPVPINFARLHNPKRDLFFVALAGPLSNFAQALIWVLILKLSGYLTSYIAVPLSLMGQAGIMINISLMLLNLLPILPLDGGRMLFAVLPPRAAMAFGRIEPYGMWILILLMLLGGLTYIIYPVYNFLIGLILSLI